MSRGVARQVIRDATIKYMQDTLLVDMGRKVHLTGGMLAEVQRHSAKQIEKERLKNKALSDISQSKSRIIEGQDRMVAHGKERERKFRRQRNGAVLVSVVITILSLL